MNDVFNMLSAGEIGDDGAEDEEVNGLDYGVEEEDDQLDSIMDRRTK